MSKVQEPASEISASFSWVGALPFLLVFLGFVAIEQESKSLGGVLLMIAGAAMILFRREMVDFRWRTSFRGPAQGESANGEVLVFVLVGCWCIFDGSLFVYMALKTFVTRG